MPLLTPSQPLSHAELSSIVRLAPLVSIDLIIRNAQEEVLLGLRSNEPAKGFYFVPGGMIRKGERLREAFSRILKDETGLTADFAEARLVGVYEHFYDNNRFAEAGYGTHYVTLGYAVRFDDLGTCTGQSAQRTRLVGRGRGPRLGYRSPQCKILFPLSADNRAAT